MSDEDIRRKDDEAPETPTGADPEAQGADEDLEAADLAEAEEAMAAAEEAEYAYGAEEDFDEDAEAAHLQEVMAEAQRDGLKARAQWTLVHKELILLLLANCLFFVGVVSAWSRFQPWDADLKVEETQEALIRARADLDAALQAQETDLNPENAAFNREQVAKAQIAVRRAEAAVERAEVGPSEEMNGLDTIRGSLIFVLALFGFGALWICFRYAQVIVWPFLLNALFALWVGIPGFTNTIGSERWDAANAYLEALPRKSFLDKAMVPLSSIPPGFWFLTLGGALVLIVLLRGVMSGAASAKQSAAASEAASGARRGHRRR